MNQNNSYSEGERSRFSPPTNRSKLSHMLQNLYSNNTTIHENNEKEQDDDICIESDDDYDNEDFEAESDRNHKMKEEPLQKKMLLPAEQARTKSANRKREELDYTR